MIRAGADVGEAVLSLRTQASGVICNVLADGRGLSQFTAKGFVRFDGSTINDSHNVSSVSVSATGQYRVFWNVDFGNANYAVGGMAHADRLLSFDGAANAAYIDLNSYATSGTRESGNYQSIIAFGTNT